MPSPCGEGITNPDINLLCEEKKLRFIIYSNRSTVAIVFSACRKINEATELGGGLIPPVDNINTFDTYLDCTGISMIFSDYHNKFAYTQE